jgi:hypothetical protein
MTLRLELFVNDLATSLDFYYRVLRFEIGNGQTDGYTPVKNGEVQPSAEILVINCRFRN